MLNAYRQCSMIPGKAIIVLAFEMGPKSAAVPDVDRDSSLMVRMESETI